MRWAGSVPSPPPPPPSVPAEAGCLFPFAASVHVFISGESLHCFLVGWCANKSYSNLWLSCDFIVQELCESRGGRPGLSVLTSLLVSGIGHNLSLICQLTSEDINQHFMLWLFINASNLLPSTPHPAPLPTWRLRAGLEIEESHTNQETVWRSCLDAPADSVEELSGVRPYVMGQCSGAVRHWGSLRGTWPPSFTYTEAVRVNLATELHLHWWLTCNNYSNRIQSLARCSQPGQPNPPTWRNAPRGRWYSSTLDGSWRMDPPSWAGDQRRGTREQLVLPSPMSKRGQGLHLREVHCSAML